MPTKKIVLFQYFSAKKSKPCDMNIAVFSVSVAKVFFFLFTHV